MAARDWFRALQVPVLPVGVGAAAVGVCFGVAVDAPLDLRVLLLVTGSILLVQLGANVHKGMVESADLGGALAPARSMWTFDAGAVGRTGLSAERARLLMLAFYTAGAGLGLSVVALTGLPALLLVGALGAFLAYSYSGWPLKLSYRGLGELSTFLAFGPLLVIGSAAAQAPAWDAGADPWTWIEPTRWTSRDGAAGLWLGSAFGILAAMVSFARYFPAREEDERKGKRTPVVRWGPRAASVGFLLLGAAGAAAFASLSPLLDAPSCRWWTGFDPFAVSAVATAGLGAAGAWVLGSGGGRRAATVVACTVLLHLAAALIVGLALLNLHCPQL